MIPFAQGETVTLRRPVGTTDAYGNVVVDSWLEADIPGCAVAQTSTTEPGAEGRDPTHESITVLVPHGTDVRPYDELRIRGVEYKVIGEPHDWTSPITGWEPGTAITVRRREG